MKTMKSETDEAVRLRKLAQAQDDKGWGLKAFRLYLEAAKLGDAESQVRVGYDYAYGMTGYTDTEEALYWWKCAFKQGSMDAAYNLGMFFRDNRQWKKAVKWFERAVEAGDDDGLIEIAKIHLRHRGDRKEGLLFLERALAARKRMTEPARRETELQQKAQAALSAGELVYMEADLLDEERRYAEALPLLEKGVALGDTSSMLLLGNYLADGRKGVAKDRERAIAVYKQAYSLKDASAATNLGMTYRKSDEIDEAFRWFELAVKAGDLEAHLNLAKIWLHDRGDKARAIENLNACFQGDASELSGGARDEARSMLRALLNER